MSKLSGKGERKRNALDQFPDNSSFAVSGSSKDSQHNALHLSHMLRLYDLIYSYNKNICKKSQFFFVFVFLTEGFAFEEVNNVLLVLE